MSNSSTSPLLGIIGGSGLYTLDDLMGGYWQEIDSPFGMASDALWFGTLANRDIVFLPRHGRGHRIIPSELNFRANIDVLKRVGVTEILSLSAVGSLKESIIPGTFVIVDQFIDRTFARVKSFFTTGLVAHVSFGCPVCKRLGDHIESALQTLGFLYHRNGTHVVIEGPQFSTYAESELYRSWGSDVIGMTNMPEAKLAREAEMCYASVAIVTDYDCWHPHYGHVSVDEVLKVLKDNASKSRSLIQALVPLLADRTELCSEGCHTALDMAIVTAPEYRSPKVMKRLNAIAGRVLNR